MLQLKFFVYEIDHLLIDTGPNNKFSELLPFFQELNPQQIVLTHIHEDHSGNAYWWEKRGVPIYLHHSTINLAAKEGKYPLYRRIFWGKRPKFTALPIAKTIKTKNFHFQVLETPGHSNDSISLYEENTGWLFTGDLYVSSRPKLFYKEESVPLMINTLTKLTKLSINTLYCAHSGKVEKGSERLKDKLEFLLELQDKVISLHQKGWSKKEIIKELFPKFQIMTYFSLREFSPKQAIDSILGNK